MTTTTIEKPAAATKFKQLAVAADHVTRHPAMRQEVLKVYPDAKFNDAGSG